MQEKQPVLQLHLLHTPRLVWTDGRTQLLQRKDAALLALLLLDGPQTRARAATLLWPDTAPEQAHSNLRQRLFRLRRSAGLALVSTEPLLSLAAGLPHDLAALQSRIEQDADAAEGELLGALDFDADGSLADWVAVARARWRGSRRELLAAHVSTLEAAHQIAAALPYAQRLVRDEPLAEHGHRRLMRLHYLRADRSAALQAYDTLCALLEHEGLPSPSAESAALATQIAGSGPASTLAAIAAAPSPVVLLRPPRLVGREAAWRLLEQARQQAHPLLVVGEPGIGKSRLLEEFSNALAADAGRPALSVQARPGDLGVPYSALARLLRAALNVLAPPPPGWVRQGLSPLVPELVASSTPPPLQALILQQATQWLLQNSQPGALVLDDLHDADDATLTLLPGLFAATPELPWLLGLRINQLPATLAPWLDAHAPAALTRVLLGPLDAPQVGELLDSLDLPGLAPQRWALALHQHTGGNPLFLLETLRALLSRKGTPDATLPLPDNIAHLFQQRLAQLTPLALKLAYVASLGGLDFSLALAAEVLACHPLDLAAPWRELEQAQVIRDSAFAHDLIQHAVQQHMPGAVAGWLHQQIAQCLARDPAAAPARLAAHWRDGGQPGAAGLAFARAAGLAKQAGRRADELKLLESALMCLASADASAAQFEAQVALVACSREVESPSQALLRADHLLALADADAERAVAHKERGVCLMNASRFELAEAELGLAIAHAQAAGDAHQGQGHHAAYLQALASAHLRGVEQAAARLDALLPWAQALGDEELRHCFLVDLAIVLSQADQRVRAGAMFEQAIRHFDRQFDLANASAARLMLARNLLMLGEVERGCALMEAAQRARSTLADGQSGPGPDTLNLGRALIDAGRYAQALQLLLPLQERCQREGLASLHAAACLGLARLFLELGQHSRALQCLSGPDAAALPFHQQAGLLWWQAQLSDNSAARAPLLARALACFTPTDLAFIRLPIAIDHATTATECEALIAECSRRELPAIALRGQLRRLHWLTDAAARDAAAALLDALPTCAPVGSYRPELLLACFQAARAAGDEALAQRSLAAARRWLAAAEAQVPPEFLDSFRHRNPVNAALGRAQ